MSDRPTPETDAFSVKFKSVCGSKAWVPTDICRLLERERDEAREESAKLRDIAERAIDNLMWFSESTAVNLNAELLQLKEDAK